MPTRTWPQGFTVDCGGCKHHLEEAAVVIDQPAQGAGQPHGQRLQHRGDRAVGLAEQAMLVAGALGRLSEVVTPSGARAAVTLDLDGDRITRVAVEVAAGDPLDVVVLRSYAIGAVHMALGWVCTEGLAVDPDTGEVHDLTIRSFGVPRATAMPPVEVLLCEDPALARARATDAVFAATAAAAWLAAGCSVALPVRTLLGR